jgi:hypothetical protein
MMRIPVTSQSTQPNAIGVTFDRIFDVTMCTLAFPQGVNFRGFAIKAPDDAENYLVGESIALERALAEAHKFAKLMANRARRA